MRKVKDNLLMLLTISFSLVGILILSSIVYFVFSNGYQNLSLDLLTGNYYDTVYNAKYENNEKEFENKENLDNFSTKWGIALKDEINTNNEKVVIINYIDPNSPFNRLIDLNTKEDIKIAKGSYISKLFMKNDDNIFISLGKDGAEKIVANLEKSHTITELSAYQAGGGIRGSILTTIAMVVLTLLIALPLGISGAIYLNEYCQNKKLKNILEVMIDMLSGVPSIIFGLVGVIIFIPLCNKLFNSTSGSILSGVFTLAIILLPVIIKTTIEALKVIPNHYRQGSLALGATKTQTVFKVILPNAFGGILMATLLSIGRIIGESAALIYVVGTAIKDSVVLNEKSTSLAVHMWTILAGENPNFELACSISIIILILVFILNVSVKIIASKINRIEVKN